jgi:transglutaminase-like putative cysteine protease
LAYVGTVVAVSLAVRLDFKRAPLAALAPLAVTAASVVLGARQTVLAVPLGLVAGLGAVLWAAWRSKTLQPGRMVALVVTFALAVGVGFGAGVGAEHRDRLVVREMITPPFDPLDYVSPLSSYRKYLKGDLKGKTLLRTSQLPTGTAVKLAVMDRFDGVVWNVAGGGEDQTSGNFGRMPATDGEPSGAAVTLEDHDTGTVWLYSVGEPAAVRFGGGEAADLREELRVNPVTGTMALPPAPPDGVTYTVTTDLARYRPDAAAIAAAEAGGVQQPTGAKVQSAEMKAASATRKAVTGGEKALALERYLQDGYYSDGQAGEGEGTSRAPSLAGHGAERIAELLDGELMVGNAEQYASAMALMARSVGLPSRVVMGFAPGYGEQLDESAHQGEQGEGEAAPGPTFTGADMTAWVEINLESLGWVPFFPTPNKQDSPEEAEQRQDPKPEPQVVQPDPPEAKPSEPPDEDMAPVPVGSAKPFDQKGPGFQWNPLTITLASTTGILLVLFGAWAAIVAVKARRRRRRRTSGPPSHRIVAGWEEVLDQMVDMRLGAVSAATTRLETAAKAPPGAVDVLRRLAAESDAAAFGYLAIPDDVARAYWDGVGQAQRALAAQLSPWRRWRSKLSLMSVRARRRSRGAERRRRRAAARGRAVALGAGGVDR